MKSKAVKKKASWETLLDTPSKKLKVSRNKDAPSGVTEVIEEFEPDSRVYTSHDVAKMLKVNPTSVNKWAAEGKITCYVTPGGHRRFSRSSVEAFAKTFSMPLFEVRGV